MMNSPASLEIPAPVADAIYEAAYLLQQAGVKVTLATLYDEGEVCLALVLPRVRALPPVPPQGTNE